MSKSPDAFRSIGEVSRLVGVAPHVLRYWESQFTQLSPVKRSDGRRYYRPDDVRLVAGLCQVMREEGMSIRGAKRLIAADRGAGLRQIGALRLGEAMGSAAAEGPAGPAVRLAVPEPVDPFVTEAAAEPDLGFAEAPAPFSAPEPVTLPPSQSRPLSTTKPEPRVTQPRADQGNWLRRLVGASATLRRAHPAALPPQLAALLRPAAPGRR